MSCEKMTWSAALPHLDSLSPAGDDSHSSQHASERGVLPTLNGGAGKTNTAERASQLDEPIPYRPCLDASPLRAPPAPVDSCRLIPLATGRIGVHFARDASGRRPPARIANTERAAQEYVAEFRQRKQRVSP